MADEKINKTYTGLWQVFVHAHRGVQLILAYIWAGPAILVAGKGRGGMFLLALPSKKYSWWAVVISQCLLYGVNNCF